MNKIDFIIKEAEEKDLPGILDIYNDAIINSTATFDTEIKNLDERKDWLNAHTINRLPVLVAKAGDVVAGWGSLSKFRDRFAYRFTLENSIYINNQYKSCGIGRSIMKELIKRAKDSGYHSIIAVISSDNDISIKFHKSLGFVTAGEIKEVGYKFDQWIDVTYMELLL